MPRDGSIPSANDHSRWRYALTTRMLENKVSRETDPPLLSPASNVIAERSRVADAHRRNSRPQHRFRRSRSRRRARTGESPQFRSRSHRDRLEHPAAAPELQTHPHCMWVSRMGRQTYPVDRWTSAPVQLSRSTSSALAHVPESSPRRFRRAISRRSSTPRASPHRRLRGTGTSYRAGVAAAATAIDRFSRPSQRSMRDCPR